MILEDLYMEVAYNICMVYFKDSIAEEGFCFEKVKEELKFENGDFHFTVMIELLPVASFLILNYPHDCYKCLSKDPDHKFSKYEYT